LFHSLKTFHRTLFYTCLYHWLDRASDLLALTYRANW